MSINLIIRQHSFGYELVLTLPISNLHEECTWLAKLIERRFLKPFYKRPQLLNTT